MSHPGEWLGLLRWSLQYQDGTTNSNRQGLNETDKDFLMAAMDSIVVDETKRMHEIMTALQDSTATERSDKELTDYFEELFDICAQVDCATDLHKIGKFVPLVEFLRSADARYRSHAAELIGVCVQNNSVMQEVALKLQALQFLSHLAVNDPSTDVQTKALLGVSCLVRGCADAEKIFVEEGDGLHVLVRGATQGASQTIRRKCVHFLSHLVTSDGGYAQDITTQELEAVTELLGQGDIDFNEGVVALLRAFGDAHKAANAHTALMTLKPALHNRMESIGRIENEEERDDAQQELTMLIELLAHLDGPAATPQFNPPAPRHAAHQPQPQRQQRQQPQPQPQPHRPRNQQQSEHAFRATHEWQQVLPGQSIPTGLHIKMDMSTGQNWAKLNDDNDGSDERNALAVVRVDRDSSHTLNTADLSTNCR
eukprot:c52653_g1_i1.p1 GENE.c52653_g1_i1~~c52653_g1_i1.p1  ORF type:complete len:425 (+),score=91.03 c52653_g1_i1:118-1392(+)